MKAQVLHHFDKVLTNWTANTIIFNAMHQFLSDAFAFEGVEKYHQPTIISKSFGNFCLFKIRFSPFFPYTCLKFLKKFPYIEQNYKFFNIHILQQ